MSLTTDVSSETILSDDGKYHSILIYVVEDDGSYGGTYHAGHFKLKGGARSKSVDEMVNDLYDILKEQLEHKKDVPFDVKNIKSSVVFDLVKCENEEEHLAALDLRRNGASCQEIKQAIQKMRDKHHLTKNGKCND